MTIQLYELVGEDAAIKFSPYVWRTRMALLHKGLDFDSVTWRFCDRNSTEHKTVPAIIDDGKLVTDSWEIAKYLDQKYPDKPSLMNGAEGEAHAQLVSALCNNLVLGTCVSMAILPVCNILDEESQIYFRETRETRFGKTLEEVNAADPQAAKESLAKNLAPFEATLEHSNFLGGDKPTYADYTLFGVLKWVDTVAYCPVEAETNIGKWFARLADMYEGNAAKAPKVNG